MTARALQQRPQPREPQRSEAAFIAELERALSTTLSDGELDRVALPLVAAKSAKRARARLAYLLGTAFEADPSRVLDIALAVELVHAASLLHDDVLDEATSRRGLPTANHLHGEVVAVLAGDLVLTRAMSRVLTLGTDAAASALDTIAEMSRAVAHEAQARGRVLPMSDWSVMAEGKTGALFGVVARLVGVAVRSPRELASYERALRLLGVAFQAADDLTDFIASGETPLVDLRDGNPSLVITLACQADPGLAEELQAAWRHRPLRESLLPLSRRVLATGATAEVERFILATIERARDELELELRHPVRGAAAARMLGWAQSLADQVRVARNGSLGDSQLRALANPRGPAKEESQP